MQSLALVGDSRLQARSRRGRRHWHRLAVVVVLALVACMIASRATPTAAMSDEHRLQLR
ncbi:hypothetical protein HK405_010880 [Cladochytrium tenue]|nr:hypothetical protein HK405_010880 [Cladochytrium tenue]